MEQYPAGLPPQWRNSLSNIEGMDETLWGSQMEGGWFALRRDGENETNVFMKRFKKGETEAALAETAIFKNFGNATDDNVATPMNSVMHDGCLVLMQEKLSGGDLWTHIANAVQDKKKSGGVVAYSENEDLDLTALILHSPG